jgi:transposase
MDTKELYEKILGIIGPWEIEKIGVNEVKNEIHVYLEYSKDTVGECPECKIACALYDFREERIWRHLDTCEFKTYIHCRMPRSNCSEHGIRTMEVPWAESMSRFTKLFERHAIFLQKATENRSKAAEYLGLSWDEMNGIMERAVVRGLSRRKDDPINYLGVDEKSFHAGQSYVQILTDTEGKRVLEVVENRDEKAVNEVYTCLTEEQKAKVKAISMDFWQPYINGAAAHIPLADIVHDKFHIMQYMNDAVDAVRRSENKRLKKGGDATLVGTKYIWLKNPENLTEKQKTTFAELTEKQLDVNRAYQRRELLKDFWKCSEEESACQFFKDWYFSATHSQLAPVIKVAKMLKRHFGNIITYFTHHISNSFAEGINSVIQHIKATARGFRSFQNYRTSILFYCGGLDLYP